MQHYLSNSARALVSRRLPPRMAMIVIELFGPRPPRQYVRLTSSSAAPPGNKSRAERIMCMCLADDQVTTSEELLEGLRTRPVAREPETASLVPDRDTD